MSKESFVMYSSYLNVINAMPTPEQGIKLLNAIAEYALNGTAPDLTDPLMKLGWANVELWVEKDAAKYRRACERNAANGKKGGRKKTQKNPKNPVGLEEPSGFSETHLNPLEPKKPYTDTDTDTDTESDTDTDTSKEVNKNSLVLFSFKSAEEKAETISGILGYFNAKHGTDCKMEDYQIYIGQRLAIYTEEQIRAVIDRSASDDLDEVLKMTHIDQVLKEAI